MFLFGYCVFCAFRVLCVLVAARRPWCRRRPARNPFNGWHFSGCASISVRSPPADGPISSQLVYSSASAPSSGSYSLELDDPYDRMVAWQLYDMEMYQEVRGTLPHLHRRSD